MSKLSLSSWLKHAENQLTSAGIDTARLDSLVLLCDELGRDKAWVLAHPEYVLQGLVLKILSTKVAQRAHHTPLAYIRGKAEFYGREFVVNEHVLVPRPESEAMIELLKAGVELRASDVDTEMLIVDVGTGSGCLAITAKLELPQADVIAIDIDPACLAVATQNAQMHGAGINMLCGDLLSPLPPTTYHLPPTHLIVLANLPYVPTAYPINKAASHEPKLALFSGEDGLDHYRMLFTKIAHAPIKPNYIMTEALTQQHDTLSRIAEAAGYTLHDTNGLAQAFIRR